MKGKIKSMRRQAKTARGADVREKVADAAIRLLGERWLDNISVSELAKEAGVVRASLLLQFPLGWPDVIGLLLAIEFSTDYADRVCELAEQPPEIPVRDRLFEVFDTLLTRADNSGLLYTNIRSQMFVLGDELVGLMRVCFADVFQPVVMMIEQVAPDGDHGARVDVADMLLSYALDLAGGLSFASQDLAERRDALRTTIDTTIGGLTR